MNFHFMTMQFLNQSSCIYENRTCCREFHSYSLIVSLGLAFERYVSDFLFCLILHKVFLMMHTKSSRTHFCFLLALCSSPCCPQPTPTRPSTLWFLWAMSPTLLEKSRVRGHSLGKIRRSPWSTSGKRMASTTLLVRRAYRLAQGYSNKICEGPAT